MQQPCKKARHLPNQSLLKIVECPEYGVPGRIVKSISFFSGKSAWINVQMLYINSAHFSCADKLFGSLAILVKRRFIADITHVFQPPPTPP
jgi:hypothetical protein